MCIAALIEFVVCGLRAALAVHNSEGARRFYVSGMVQGVGYRYFAQRAAQRLGLVGYVRNLGDGRVEVYAIGDSGALAQLRRELERGPRSAVVSSVAEEEAPLDLEFTRGFSVEYDA
jgi:acylphosphatase